ncbi:MAG: hypothetical protein JW862_08570 [Anaerolineales bacterium]|nr:hypothetical protein [Anaerolineales bacterium]
MKSARLWWLVGIFSLVVIFGSLAGLLLQAGKGAQRPMPARSGWQTIRPPGEVSALALQETTLWAGGREGVVPINTSTQIAGQPLACDLPLAYVQALLVDNEGILWIGHPNGLSRYDGQECSTLGLADGLPDLRVNTLYQDRSGRLWVGTWGGAAVRTGQSWQVFKTADGLPHDMINAILEDSQGNMWFGTYVAPQGGISVCFDDECQTFSTDNGLPHNNITSIIEDEQGYVWAGTGLYHYGGAARFARTGDRWEIVTTLDESDGLAGEKVRSIFQDLEGNLWFGSEYDGLARWGASGWRVFGTADGLSHPEVKTMLQDEQNNLWIGTYDGVTRISAEALQSLDH